MKKITYNNVPDKLVEMFPEYRSSHKYYDELNKDLPYMVLGNLALMAFEDIDEKQGTELAERLLKLMDEIMNDPDSDDNLINLFQIEVFEKIVATQTGAKLAKTLLHSKSLDLLDQTLKFYNTKQFLEEYRRQ